eukprot:1274768-Amphidinium_carterae.1
MPGPFRIWTGREVQTYFSLPRLQAVLGASVPCGQSRGASLGEAGEHLSCWFVLGDILESFFPRFPIFALAACPGEAG